MQQQLDSQLASLMQQYSDDVCEQIQDSLNTVGKQAVEKLKAGSPKRKGKYAKGWRLKTKKTGREVEITVYNSGSAQLTHLLENGHKKRNRSGWVNGHPHIEPVQDWAETAAQKAIEKAVHVK